MKKLLLVLYLSMLSTLITSCATWMNEKHKKIKIYTNQPSQIIFNGDTIQTQNNKARLNVERKKETINIIAHNDSVTKNIRIEPINSIAYWGNIVTNYGIGMMIDRDEPKRYSYPRRVYLSLTDTISKYYTYNPFNNKVQLDLHLSLPYINSFLFSPEGESTKTNTGFFGITLGLDYYHSNNQFINMGIGAVRDFRAPVPAPVTIWGEYDLMNSKYISLSNNHKIKHFSVGYGLAYAINTWDHTHSGTESTPQKAPVKKTSHAFGFIFPTYFQLGHSFNAGIIYRPTFYRPNITDQFKYEHLISLDLAWKIKLKK